MPGRLRTPPPGVVPPLTCVRTDVWDVEIERYGLVGYTVYVHEQGSGLAASEYTFTRAGAKRWAARHIRAERRARARTPERFTIAPEDLV